MDFTPADELHSTMVPVYKDRRFCDCTTDSCDCGETLKEYEWVWDTNSADPESIVLSCQNRETLFHPRSSQGTTAIRGTTPFKSGHVYYWEVKMLSTLYGTDVAWRSLV
ncbi:SPRY domain-containing SOCS box protein 3-like [Diaphorina citri]|uniref:SPRY domain-containing SOCS box protein 3-like n=1 Tax=Diaphorina citri TaxID=121845 RepID=A0A1S3DE32_DIACI|nr:SPRY domain-containing SOCS box protein 3-like [Diaphorina citri]